MMSTVRQLKLNLLADTSDFQAGIKRATGETQSFQSKLKDSAVKIGKSFAIAGAAVGALAIKVGVESVKAALDDQKAQRRLAIALKNSTGATSKQVKAVEKYISKTSLATGIADDELRPAFQKLTQVTKSTTKAQDLMSLALDVSAGTGKSVESVSTALTRAYGGNLSSLKKLGIGLDENTLKSKDTKKAFKELSDTYAGQSAKASESLEGKMKRLKVAMDETKESIGIALLPFVERLSTFMTTTGIDAVEGFVGAFTGKDGKGLDGIAASAYNLGQKLKGGMKWVIDNKDKFAMFAVAWAGFWTANKALIVTNGITTALATIRAAMVTTTAVSATAATAEAAATGGASLIPALGAMTALAIYFGIKKFGWKGNAPKYTPKEAAALAGTTKGTAGTNGIPYSAPSYNPYSTTGQPLRQQLRGTTVNNVINLNGIIDGESARRSIEQVLQRSSLRSGAINLVGSAI